MGEVVELNVVTSLNLPPERVLRKAIEANLGGIVIAGYDKSGEYYFASSIADGADVMWLLEQCKKRLLDEESSMSGAPGTEGA